MVNKHSVDIITYEKGVEEVMQSCASGATAVVFHLSKNKLVESPVNIHSTGGNLTVTFDRVWRCVWTEGPAEILFTGSFKMEVII